MEKITLNTITVLLVWWVMLPFITIQILFYFTKEKTCYYFVSYAYEDGFGSVYCRAKRFLNIKGVKKDLEEGRVFGDNKGVKGVIILNIISINKEQYEGSGI